MRKRLQHGLQEFEILTYGESRPNESYLKFPDNEGSLDLVRSLAQDDAKNAGRLALPEMGGPRFCTLGNHEVNIDRRILPSIVYRRG